MTTTQYDVTVTDHAAGETHTDPEPIEGILDAKEWAAEVLHRVYCDAPDEVAEQVELLIGRINNQRGPLKLHDEYLDCTVEISAA